MRLAKLVVLAIAVGGCSAKEADRGGDRAALALEARQSVLAVVGAPIDLRAARRMPREQRGAFVYDTLRAKANASQADLVSWLRARGHTFTQHYLLNAIEIEDLNAGEIAELSQRSDVLHVVPNQTSRQVVVPAAALLPADKEVLATGSNIRAVDADRVWDELGVNGAGIVVAGQDTGIDWDHPALVNQYRGTTEDGVDHDYNWHDAIRSGGFNKCGFSTEAPCDDHGHGTHTLGTVVGVEGGGGNAVGMAPGAQWIGCRNMNNGAGTPSRYLSCFEFFLAPYPHGGDPLLDGDPARAAHVINNSWGCDASEGCVTGEEFRPMLEALDAAGIFVVVSAGNSGPSCGTITAQPATHSDLTFTVGAVSHQSGTIASFSSRGPSSYDGEVGPGISAPGVGIRSAVPGGGYQGGWSGTSMAGPHVAGLVALMWSANPALVGDIETTSQIIRDTAVPRTTSQSCGAATDIPNASYGYGIIDAFAAVSMAQTVEVPEVL